MAGRPFAALLPTNALVSTGLLVLPAVAVGICSLRYGHRVLDWLAEPRS